MGRNFTTDWSILRESSVIGADHNGIDYEGDDGDGEEEMRRKGKR